VLTIRVDDDLSRRNYHRAVGTIGGCRPFQAIAACALLTVGVVSSPAHAATQAGTAKAVALKPLSIVKISDLDFGNMIAGAAAGTVVIDPDTDARIARKRSLAVCAARDDK